MHYSLAAGLPYDMMNRAVFNFMEPRKDLFEHLDMQEGANLIEICAGTGLNLRYYPKSAKGCVSDRNERMLKSAEKKARGLSGLDFEVLDATQLPFGDDVFDYGIVTYGLAAIPDNAKALSELRRVVASGGKIGLIEFDTEESVFSGTAKLDIDDLIRNSGMEVVYKKDSYKYRLHWLPFHKQVQTEYILAVD